MIKNKMKVLAGTLAVPLLVFGVVGVVGSTDVAAQVADGIEGGMSATGQTEGKTGDVNDIVEKVVNAMLFVIGAAAVIMLIYGGIRYTTSGGNSQFVTTAKNTILYALIGLVFAILAYALVNWVFHLFD